MGYMDRLFWSPDDEDADEDEHSCREHYAIIERGNYIRHGRNITYSGIEVYFAQEVLVECQECGEQEYMVDQSEQQVKTVEWDSERERRDEEIEDHSVMNDRGMWTGYYGDMPDHTGGDDSE